MFGTPSDVTLAEIAPEGFFPTVETAGRAAADAHQQVASSPLDQLASG